MTEEGFRPIIRLPNGASPRREAGFTLIEVVIASSIMLVLVVGVLSVFSYATNINRANNIRSQALTILQNQAEYYRSLNFKRGSVSTVLNAGTYTVGERVSADGTRFTVTAVIENLPNTSGGAAPADAAVTLKRITIEAQPVADKGTWFGGKTNLVILRVKAN